MSFGQLLFILRARWVLGVGVMVGCTLVTLAVSLLLPDKYMATASVVLDVKAIDPVTGQGTGAMLTASNVATQIDIIRSDRVAQRVAQVLNLTQNVNLQQQWEDVTGRRGSFEAWLGNWMKTGLDVKPGRESNVIAIEYSYPDPKFAAVVANAFVQAYIDTTLQLRVDPARQYSGFFDERVKAARDKLESAQSNLSAFQKTNGIVAGDERLDVETARMDQLSAQLVALRSATADSSSRAALARSEVQNSQDVMSNPIVSGLKAEVLRQEAALQQLSARLGDRNPQVIEAKANINALQTRLEEEVRRAVDSVSVSNSVNQAREAEIRAEFDQQRAKVLKIKALRDEMLVLQQDVANAQRAYEALQSRLTQSSLESQNTQTNVSVLNRATEPYARTSPKPLQNTVVAGLVGLVLGFAVVLVREVLDRRVRSVEDIVGYGLDVPVLGFIPKTDGWPSLLGRRKQSPWLRQHVLRQLPAPR